jgi:RimJ/RimL family protein N-acetyltransferase
MRDGSRDGVPRAVAFDERFLARSWEWLQDDELRDLIMSPLPTREGQAAWFEALPSRTDYRVWGIEVEGEPIGAFGIKHIHGSAGEYWGYIGEKEFWGRGIGGWMMEEALERAREIPLERLYLQVAEGNARAIALYRRNGYMVREHTAGVIRMEREVG